MMSLTKFDFIKLKFHCFYFGDPLNVLLSLFFFYFGDIKLNASFKARKNKKISCFFQLEINKFYSNTASNFFYHRHLF